MFHPRFSITDAADICDDYFPDNAYEEVKEEDECEEDEEYIPKSITKDFIKEQEQKNGNNRKDHCGLPTE